MDDTDTKPQLPIHIVLGNREYARIKTSTKPLVGKELEPIGEKTKLGWFIMSPGVEFDNKAMLLTQSSQADFENLCRLDVLGLADTSGNDQVAVYKDFKENLVRNEPGWYEPAPTEVTSKEFYIPHKGIVKCSASYASFTMLQQREATLNHCQTTA